MSEQIIMFIFRCFTCGKSAAFYDRDDAPDTCPMCKRGKLSYSHEEMLPADEDKKNG